MTLPLEPRRGGRWVRDEGTHRDVVLSSRVRLARNLDSYPFPSQASPDDKRRILRQIRRVTRGLDACSDWTFLRMGDLSSLERQLLQERRIISQDLNQPHGGVLFGADESHSMMVNEEDHVRLQSLEAGFQLDRAYQRVSGLERELDEHLSLAFDERWGFLTSCPTNLGTGLRASVLLHLPALVIGGEINRVLKAISNLGLTVRGFAGEGSGSQGFYFQLSNQVTLGQTGEQLKDNLNRVTQQIVGQERDARQNLARNRELELEDRVWRAYGVLRHARTIDSTEALQMLSLCRLGVSDAILPGMSVQELDELLLFTQPAHLQLDVEEELSNPERDFYRARKIRRTLADAFLDAGGSTSEQEPET